MTKEIKVNDIVLVEQENVKRSYWPLVKELFLGKDGNCRLAKLETNNGEWVRPVQRLFPLEKQGSDLLDEKMVRMVSPI